MPYHSEKVVVRSRQDEEVIALLKRQTVRVNVDGIERYATPLLRVQNMPLLHAPPEAVPPHLRSTEKWLAKNPEQASDIRGMFHQVRLLPTDRSLLRFLWRDMQRDSPPRVYEWQVLPFGTTCSPCCAIFALQKHVTDNSQEGEDVHTAIQKSFYVDNCLQSLSSMERAKALIAKLHHLLAKGGFALRQWASNDPSIISHLPAEATSTSCELWLSHGQPDTQESALGLHWHCESDTLTYKLSQVKYSVPTMRNTYNVLASQYDPLGYIVPYTTRAKVIVQCLWDKKREWDDPRICCTYGAHGKQSWNTCGE